MLKDEVLKDAKATLSEAKEMLGKACDMAESVSTQISNVEWKLFEMIEVLDKDENKDEESHNEQKISHGE